MPKPLCKLTGKDLVNSPVWEFDNGHESVPGRDETWVFPVVDLPVETLSNRVAAVALQFGRRKVMGMLGNIDLDDLLATREFATLSVYKRRTWFHLSRYFDPDYEQCGPMQLAEFLGMLLTEVFPIRYDLSSIAVGHPRVVEGRIDAEPDVRLSESERLDLIFERLRYRS